MAETEDNIRAIADYNEATRVNPKAADPYSRRASAWNLREDYDWRVALGCPSNGLAGRQR